MAIEARPKAICVLTPADPQKASKLDAVAGLFLAASSGWRLYGPANSPEDAVRLVRQAPCGFVWGWSADPHAEACLAALRLTGPGCRAVACLFGDASEPLPTPAVAKRGWSEFFWPVPASLVAARHDRLAADGPKAKRGAVMTRWVLRFKPGPGLGEAACEGWGFDRGSVVADWEKRSAPQAELLSVDPAHA